MARESDPPRSRPAQSTRPTAQELEGAIDRGHTGDKVAFFDPAASPLGTDDEAAGTPETPPRSRDQEDDDRTPELIGYARTALNRCVWRRDGQGVRSPAL